MRRIPTTGNTNEVIPIAVDETPDTGGASGSGHQSYDAPAAEQTAIATSASAIREMPESHMPDLAVQRRHVLQGHLGHASWCQVCVQARARDDPHERKPAIERLRIDVGGIPLI